MSHECDDCGQEFETLSALRLHDCLQAGDSGPRSTEISELKELLDTVEAGEFDTLHRAMATYETRLAAAHAAEQHEQYRSIASRYRERLITGLDDATQTKGWGFLEEFIDAYHPTTAEELPHLTPLLQNVTSRHMIRVRIRDGVDSIPVTALEYFRAILDENPEGYDFITEGLHPYGWGIGHPDHPVADNIHDHASRDKFVVNPMLEHAFYADQHAAVDLLERMVHDDSVQYTFDHPTGEVTKARHLLDAPAGAVSDFSPTVPRYWDWEAKLGYSFELADEVAGRIRDLVVETDLDSDLPDDWEITDMTL